MDHRGPDFSQTYKDPHHTVLGHNRLAIIDLSSDANQPFADESNRYHLVFNGEIYNYTELQQELRSLYDFKTSSDTEVLLAAYIIFGRACLERLEGMFSFAIWDAEKKTLFAARDRFGVKPFYYYQREGIFVFASEIKAIFKAGVSKTPNKTLWERYFASGSYGNPDETFWENVQQLPGGTLLELVNGVIETKRWYCLEDKIPSCPLNISFDDAQTQLSDLIKRSIALRFRSDVPVGLNISGGLDSATLLSYVHQTQNSAQNIESFSFLTNDARYDELPWVKTIINHYENPLNEVMVSPSYVINNSATISKIQDEPFGGVPTIAYSKIFKSASRKGIRVLLDGQGMDEIFCGYDYFSKHSNSTIQGTNDSPFRKKFVKGGSHHETHMAYPRPFDDALLNKQYRDLLYTKIPRALRFNDRASMAFSTELREPFLDHHLVEFGMSLPQDFKIKNGQGKYILRELMKKHSPSEITLAPKRPLQTPQREWISGPLKNFVEENLLQIENSQFADWFNIDEIRKEWQIYLNGNNDSSFHIWQLVNFSLLMCYEE